MAKSNKNKKITMIMIISAVLALLAVVSCFLPWISVTTSSSLLDKQASEQFYGHNFIGVIADGDSILEADDKTALAIHAWLKSEKTSAATNGIMVSVVGSLLIGAAMLVVSLLGVLSKKRIFALVNRIVGIVLAICGIVGIACCYSVVNAVFALDIGMIVSVSAMVIAPFMIMIFGLATTVLSLFVMKRKK